jgi:hypothetical protein
MYLWLTYVNNNKEVKQMPRNDGTGPMGKGTMTGRGLGRCAGSKRMRYGARIGIGLGVGLACRGLARAKKAELLKQNNDLKKEA